VIRTTIGIHKVLATILRAASILIFTACRGGHGLPSDKDLRRKIKSNQFAAFDRTEYGQQLMLERAEQLSTFYGVRLRSAGAGFWHHQDWRPKSSSIF
jgi:hypothetical protein